MRFERLKALAGNRKTWMALITILAAGVVAAGLLIGHRAPGIPGLDVPGGADKPVKGKLSLNVKEENLPEIPDEMLVYKFDKIAKNEEQIKELAAKFGLTGELKKDFAKREDPAGLKKHDHYYVKEGEIGTGRHMQYFINTGNYLYIHEAKYGHENHNLPTTDECRSIALETLENLGLLPDDAFVAGTGGILTSTGPQGEPGRVYFDHRDVMISRRAGGYPIAGPGMEIVVSLGTNGELVGIDSMMRELVPYKGYKVKSVEQAVKDAEKGSGTMNLHPEVEDPEVTKVEIIYYADPAKPENKYLQPVYCFTGPETCIYVPAIKQ